MKYLVLFFLYASTLFAIPKTNESVAKQAANEMRIEMNAIKKSFPELKNKWFEVDLEDETLDDLWNDRWGKIANDLGKLSYDEYDLRVTQILEKIILFSLAAQGQIEELYLPIQD